MRSFIFRTWGSVVALTAFIWAIFPAQAATISFSGVITQSTQDGTGPALDNASLNGIADGDAYLVTLDFPFDISGLGSFNPLAGATLTFSDSATASESDFGQVFLNVSANADPALYDVNLLGCLNSGSGCFVGNELSVSLSVPAVSFTGTNTSAQLIPGIFPPLDLLEDDGITDIQGTVVNFFNSSAAAAAPEPSSLALVAASFAVLNGRRLWSRRNRNLSISQTSPRKQ